MSFATMQWHLCACMCTRHPFRETTTSSLSLFLQTPVMMLLIMIAMMMKITMMMAMVMIISIMMHLADDEIRVQLQELLTTRRQLLFKELGSVQ